MKSNYTSAAEMIYVCVLVHKYSIFNVLEFHPNEFVVIMKKDRKTKSVILKPKVYKN